MGGGRTGSPATALGGRSANEDRMQMTIKMQGAMHARMQIVDGSWSIL